MEYGICLCYLQIYVVQDNVEVYAEDQYEELQKRNYADVDGPAYRFCTEPSQRHKGNHKYCHIHESYQKNYLKWFDHLQCAMSILQTVIGSWMFGLLLINEQG